MWLAHESLVMYLPASAFIAWLYGCGLPHLLFLFFSFMGAKVKLEPSACTTVILAFSRWAWASSSTVAAWVTCESFVLEQTKVKTKKKT